MIVSDLLDKAVEDMEKRIQMVAMQKQLERVSLRWYEKLSSVCGVISYIAFLIYIFMSRLGVFPKDTSRWGLDVMIPIMLAILALLLSNAE